MNITPNRIKLAMSDESTNGWNEYQRLVLHELQAHTKELDKIQIEIQKIHIELATLKVKSGVWGLIAGTIPVAIAVVLKALG
jgi:hypothetical protein